MRAVLATVVLAAVASISAVPERVRAQTRDQDDPAPSALAARAWALFLADRSAEAAASYVAVLDHAPMAERADALVMLAALLADVDWDHDGTADAETPVARLSDAAVVPQDRSWLPALAWATAHALYLSSRDAESIAVAAWALARWEPPTGVVVMAPACRRHRARPESLHVEDGAVRAAADATCARLGL